MVRKLICYMLIIICLCLSISAGSAEEYPLVDYHFAPIGSLRLYSSTSPHYNAGAAIEAVNTEGHHFLTTILVESDYNTLDGCELCGEATLSARLNIEDVKTLEDFFMDPFPAEGDVYVRIYTANEAKDRFYQKSQEKGEPLTAEEMTEIARTELESTLYDLSLLPGLPGSEVLAHYDIPEPAAIIVDGEEGISINANCTFGFEENIFYYDYRRYIYFPSKGLTIFIQYRDGSYNASFDHVKKEVDLDVYANELIPYILWSGED